MRHLEINVPAKTVIGVVGDIHEQEDKFDEIVEQFKPDKNRWLISLGDIYDKGFGIKTAESIVNKLKKINEQNFGFTILGNHDFKHIRKAVQTNYFSEQLAWLDSCPFSITFTFINKRRLTVVHGGVTPKDTPETLFNSDVLYVRTIEGRGQRLVFEWSKKTRKIEAIKNGTKSWHEAYDGRFGYIIAGHDAQKDGIVKYYPYSCNVDTACYYTGVLSCQIFNEVGLQELIQVKSK